MGDKQDATEVPLSPAWKIGRGQEPPKSALIADGPWSSNTGSTAPGGFPTAQFPKSSNPTSGSFSTRLQQWQSGGGAAVNSALIAPSGGAPAGNRWREDERDGKPFSGRPGDRWSASEDNRWAGTEQRTGDRWGGDAGGRGRGRPEDRWGTGNKDREWATNLPGMGDLAELSKRNSERWDNGQTGGGGDRWRSPGPGAPGAPSSTGGGFDSTGPSAGRGRGFAVGRGRGIRPPYPGAPGAGAERWALSGAGGHVSSATGSGRSYSPQELKRVHDHLVAVHGPNLPLPDGVNMPDYTGLLPEGEGDGYSGEGHHPYRPFGAANADRAGRWLAGERTASGRMDDGPHGGAPSQAPTTVSPAAFAADRWVYRDPQGDVQGPFTKVDILDWFEAGFFPQDLPIKSEVDPPEVPFVPLATMLKMWAAIGSGRAPPGFVPPSAAHAAPQQHQQHQPQQQDAPNPGRSLLEALGKQLQEPGTPQHYAGGRPPAPPQQGPGLMSPLDQVLGLGGPRPLMQQPGGQPGLGMGMGGGLWGAGGPGGLLGGPGANGGAGGAGLLGSAWQRGPGEMGDAGPSYRPLGGGLLGPQPHGQPPQGGPVLGGGMWGFQPAPPPDAPQHDGWGAAQPPQPPPQQQPAASQQQQQPQPPHPQQQQQQPAPAAPWAQQGAAGSGQKSLAEIQREQASEAARHGGQAPPPPAPAEAVQDKPAAPKGLEGLHPNLQQLFVAVQRAQTQGQAPGQAPAAPAQPAAAAAPAAPAPAAAAPNQKAKKGKDEGKPEPAEQPAAPAEPAPPVKVAPWAAASAKAATGKTLREIQEEEAARAAEEAARAAAHDAQAAAAPAPAATAAPSPWARIAAANAGVVSPPGPWGNTAAAAAAAAAPAAARPVPLSAIMSKEMEDSKARAAAASSSPPVGTGPGPRGSTIAELMEKIINPSPAAKATAWGGAATRAPAAPSLRDVMFEESAADLEGGAMDEDLSDLLPPQPARPAPAAPVSTWVPPAPAQAKTLREIQEEEERRARAARQAAAPPPPAAKPAGDDDLFWDYDAPSGAAAPPPPPPPPAAPAPKPAVTLANIAAKNMPAPAPPAARPAAPAPAAKPSAWAAAAGPSKAVTAAPTVQQPAASVARANGVAAGAARPAAAARPAESAALASSAGASASSGAPLVFGDLVLSSDFRDWCAREMVKFFDSPDLSLIEFLMTLASRSEVAEYCAMYMSGKQGVSTFVAEFLKRKDAEVAKASNPGKKKGKAAAAAPAPVTAASVVKAAVAAPPLPKPPVGGAIPGDDWQQIPGATAATKGGAKAQPKGGAKGAAGAKKGGFAVLGGL